MKLNIKRTILFASVCLSLTALTSCEKDVDYTIPPEANTRETDMQNTFDYLSKNDSKWFWSVPLSNNSLFGGNQTFGFLMDFRKDSSATAHVFVRKSIVNQLNEMLATGSLTTAQTTMANSLIRSFAGLTDLNLRNALFTNASNATFLNNLKTLLPNIVDFNPMDTIIAERNFNYNVNSIVQLSLTYTNTSLFPQLKQSRLLDYDFRIFNFNEQKIDLNGYYSNNANKVSSLYALSDGNIQNYLRGTRLLAPEMNIVIGKTSMKIKGTAVNLPDTDTSALQFFYKSFKNNVFINKANNFGFELLSNVTNIPEGLKSSKYFVIQTVFTGDVRSVSSGTTILTLKGLNADGADDGNTVEFVKI